MLKDTIDMKKRGKGFHWEGSRLRKMEKQSHLFKVTHSIFQVFIGDLYVFFGEMSV